MHQPLTSENRLLLTLGGGSLITCSLWVWLLCLPHQVERVEVHVRALVQWWRAGIVPYGDGSHLPILQNPYGPVYTKLLAVLPDGPNPYFVGRFLTLLAVAGSLAAIWQWVWKQTENRTAAWVAALLPLTIKPWLLFGPLYRVDVVAIFLSLLGFAWVTLGRNRSTDRLAALAFGLALCTKLTAVAAPAAAFLWLLGRDRRRALVLAGMIGVAGLSSVAVMEWWTGGTYLQSAAMGNLPRSIDKSFDLLLRNGLWFAWWLAVLKVARRRIEAWGSPAALYLLMSLLFAMTFGANPLSSWNYLLEPSLALALWTGYLLGHERPEQRQTMQRWLTLHAAMAIPLLALTSASTVRELVTYRPAFEEAVSCLRTKIEAEGATPRLAALDSLAVQDGLNYLSVLSWAAGTKSVLSQPVVRNSLSLALAQGELDEILDARAIPFTCRANAAALVRLTRQVPRKSDVELLGTPWRVSVTD